MKQFCLQNRRNTDLHKVVQPKQDQVVYIFPLSLYLRKLPYVYVCFFYYNHKRNCFIIYPKNQNKSLNLYFTVIF